MQGHSALNKKFVLLTMASFYAPIFHRENNNEKIKESESQFLVHSKLNTLHFPSCFNL